MPLFVGGAMDGRTLDVMQSEREYGVRHFFVPTEESSAPMQFAHMRMETYRRMRWAIGAEEGEVWHLNGMKEIEVWLRLMELAAIGGKTLHPNHLARDAEYFHKLVRNLERIATNMAISPDRRAELVLEAMGLGFTRPWTATEPPKKNNPYTNVRRPVARRS